MHHKSHDQHQKGGWLPSMHHRSHDQGGHPVGGGSASGGEGSASRGCLPTGGGVDPPGTGKADGTHPTGMLSCIVLLLFAPKELTFLLLPPANEVVGR